MKDIRNLFRLRKKLNYTAIKDYKLKQLKTILRDIIIFENKEEENYYKPVRVSNFWSKIYTEYESNTDRNKKIAVEENLNKSRPYLKDIINNFKKSDT